MLLCIDELVGVYYLLFFLILRPDESSMVLVAHDVMTMNSLLIETAGMIRDIYYRIFCIWLCLSRSHSMILFFFSWKENKEQRNATSP